MPRRQTSVRSVEPISEDGVSSGIYMNGNSVTSSQRKDKKKARFGDVQVRFYEQIMDINPSVSNGVAVGIGWKYEDGTDQSIDEWEAKRPEPPRTLVLSRPAREMLALEAGYTQKEIAEATRKILKLKRQRKATIEQLTMYQYTEEAIEAATGKLRKLLSFGAMKKSDSSTNDYSSSSDGAIDYIFE